MSFILERTSECQIPSAADESELYNLKSSTIANARGQSAMEWKCLTFHALCCFANTICLACVCFGSQQPAIEPILTLFSLAACVFHGFKLLSEERFHRSVYGDSFSGKREGIVCGILVGVFYLLHPSNICQGIALTFDQFAIQLNSILTTAVTLRIISILHFLIVSSRFYGARTSRVLEIYGVKERLSVWYAIRSIYKVKALKVPFFLLLTILSLVPFMRVKFEVTDGEKADFIQQLYDTVITMTTVGYGDIDHSSNFLLRILMVLIVLLGSFTSSMMTLTIINFFNHTPNESRAFHIHKRLQLIQSLKEQQIIQFRQLVSNKISKKNGSNLQQSRQLISKKRKQLSRLHGQGLVHGHLSSQFVNIQRDLKKVAQKQLLISNLMDFYFSRGKGGFDEPKSPKSARSARSRKRADDSVTVGKLFDLIVKN